MICDFCGKVYEDGDGVVETFVSPLDGEEVVFAFHAGCVEEIDRQVAGSQVVHEFLKYIGTTTMGFALLRALSMSLGSTLAGLVGATRGGGGFTTVENIIGHRVLSQDISAQLAWRMSLEALDDVMPAGDLSDIVERAGRVMEHQLLMLAPFLDDDDPAAWFEGQDAETIGRYVNMNRELIFLSGNTRRLLPGASAAGEDRWMEKEPADEFPELRMSPYWTVGPVFAVVLGSLVYAGDSTSAVKLIDWIEGNEFMAWFNHYLFSLERLMSAAIQAAEEGLERRGTGS